MNTINLDITNALLLIIAWFQFVQWFNSSKLTVTLREKIDFRKRQIVNFIKPKRKKKEKKNDKLDKS